MGQGESLSSPGHFGSSAQWSCWWQLMQHFNVLDNRVLLEVSGDGGHQPRGAK